MTTTIGFHGKIGQCSRRTGRSPIALKPRQDTGSQVAKKNRKGMEGLVKETLKHSVQEAPEDEKLLDIVFIAQYQRMSQYAMAGFGSFRR